MPRKGTETGKIEKREDECREEEMEKKGIPAGTVISPTYTGKENRSGRKNRGLGEGEGKELPSVQMGKNSAKNKNSNLRPRAALSTRART